MAAITGHNSRGEKTNCLAIAARYTQPGWALNKNAQQCRAVLSLEADISLPRGRPDGTWHTGGGEGQ